MRPDHDALLMIVANKWDSIKDENNPQGSDRLGLKALCQRVTVLSSSTWSLH